MNLFKTIASLTTATVDLTIGMTVVACQATAPVIKNVVTKGAAVRTNTVSKVSAACAALEAKGAAVRDARIDKALAADCNKEIIVHGNQLLLERIVALEAQLATK